MLLRMQPLNFVTVPKFERVLPDQLENLQRKSVEQFISQFDVEIKQKLSIILGGTISIISQLWIQSAQIESVTVKLQDISNKLAECRQLADSYLVLTRIMNTYEYRKDIEFLSTLTNAAINLINQITDNNPNLQKILSSFIESYKNLSTILSKQKIEFITKDSVDELFKIIAETSNHHSTDAKTLVIIQDCVKHILWNENPQEFLISLTDSILEATQGLQEIRANSKYSDIDNIKLIKSCIAKFSNLDSDSKEYILQLGCELLKLHDAQGALEVFNSVAKQEDIISPELLFDKALALIEVGGIDNYTNAKLQLEQLIQIIQQEKQNMSIDLNNVRVLLVTALDRSGQYEEATKQYNQISAEHQPETIFEELLLLKYQYNASLSSQEPNLIKKEIIKQICSLIKDEELIKNLVLESCDPDFYYLIGMGHASQNNLSKASEYFRQSIDQFEPTRSLLITAKSYVVYHMLSLGVIACDEELVDKLLTKIEDIEVDWLPNGYDCTPLYLAAEDVKTNIPIILLDRGANPFAVCKSTELTPIHRAVQTVNHKLLEKVCDLNPITDHSGEQSMDYQLGMIETLPNAEKIFLAQCLEKMGYETRFQTQYLGDSQNPASFE